MRQARHPPRHCHCRPPMQGPPPPRRPDRPPVSPLFAQQLGGDPPRFALHCGIRHRTEGQARPLQHLINPPTHRSPLFRRHRKVAPQIEQRLLAHRVARPATVHQPVCVARMNRTTTLKMCQARARGQEKTMTRQSEITEKFSTGVEPAIQKSLFRTKKC